MPEQSILELSCVSKRFSGVPVIVDLSLAVATGEHLGLIGPNGAGKTTLINIITGKYKPDAGRVFYRGQNVTSLPAHRRARIGIGRSFQIVSLFAEATVEENIRAAVLRKHGVGAHPARRLGGLHHVFDECEQLGAQVGLLPLFPVRVDQLPYGLQRRLDIALVLAQDPELLILDEPAAGLSAAETRDLIALLKRLVGGRSLVLVEHDMEVVYALSDRITVLDYGRVLADGTPAEISTDRAVRRVYLGEETA